MKSTFKKIGVCLSLLLVMVMTAFPAFAIVEDNSDGLASYICGWQGSGANWPLLKGNGKEAYITVGTDNGVGENHVWYVLPNGGGYLIAAGDQSYYVNFHRIMEGGVYYPCLGYEYENVTGGRDQRVQLLQYGSYTVIKIMNPIVGGTWYLMADYSQPVANSNVIWYTNSSLMKAHWY